MNKKYIVTTACINALSLVSGLFIGKKIEQRKLEKANCDGNITIIDSKDGVKGFYLCLPDENTPDKMKNKPYAIFKVKIVVDNDQSNEKTYDA